MKTYISILRGINVSGSKMLKMDALKKLYTGLGFENILTYIQSGNVVFQAEPENQTVLETKIAGEIAREYSYDVPVIVLDISEYQEIVNKNPLAGDPLKDEGFLHVTFLASHPDTALTARLIEISYPGEEFVLIGKAIYLYCPNGYGNTKLNNNFFESKLKVRATTRNWRTTKVLLEMALKIS